MEPIYSNFDGLDITFQCAIPEKVLEVLAEAKKLAQETKSDAVAKIGNSARIVLVGETGAKGGFTYRFDTGDDGETWFVVHSPKRDGWNVKVSAKSLALALYGYSGVKERILKLLIEELGAKGVTQNNPLVGAIDPTKADYPLERISRLDFCIDFKTDLFLPDIKAFIGKGRFKKRMLKVEDDKSTSQIIFSGQNTKYFRIGSMPNRQVVLYDKIADITEKRKSYWWRLWGIKKSEFKGQIWRIEARAGKKELNQWNLRRFADFDKRAGDVISGILEDIKYTIPSITDKNINRWPVADFWQKARDISKKKLENHISNSERKLILEGIKIEIQNQFEKSILGQTVSYAALLNMDVSEIPAVLEALGDVMMDRISQNQEKFKTKHQKATDKYANLNK